MIPTLKLATSSPRIKLSNKNSFHNRFLLPSFLCLYFYVLLGLLGGLQENPILK